MSALVAAVHVEQNPFQRFRMLVSSANIAQLLSFVGSILSLKIDSSLKNRPALLDWKLLGKAPFGASFWCRKLDPRMDR